MNENNYLSRDRLLSERRRRVPTTLGQDVLVRALGYGELAGMVGFLMDVASLGVDSRAAEPAELMKTPQASKLMASIDKIIIAGAIEPKFGLDPAAGPVPGDLPLPDQLAVFTAILELSGYSRAAGKDIRPS